MPDLPQPTEADIRHWCGEASFARGRRYFELGHILRPHREGRVLKARCRGSYAPFYRVEVTLDAEGVIFGNCSCPVGGGGHCKHAAALLLTWLHDPEAFSEREEQATSLELRSKDELIALVQMMLDRYPDLESLLELPIVGGIITDRPLDPEAVRQHAVDAFWGGDGEYRARSIEEAAHILSELIDMADTYVQHQDAASALLVYSTVSQRIANESDTFQDHSGTLEGIMDACVTGLDHCLTLTQDDGERERVLRELFALYRWSLKYGGESAGWCVPEIILEHATAEERRQVAVWVREALPAKEGTYSSYLREAYGGFLIDLEEEQLDDEDFLQICRQTERWEDLVDRLLALGRMDEAVRVARQVSDYMLLSLADLFVTHDQAVLAETLVRERAQASRDDRLVLWLKRRALKRGEKKEALALTEALFWRRPSLDRYQEVRQLARLLDQWEALRMAILDRLAGEGQYSLLTKIHLEEGQVSRALETLARIQRPSWHWGGESLRLQVAQAAEEEHPGEAIRIYLEMVERLISARGRENYATAAVYLGQVRDLYRRMGKPAAWRTLIHEIRENNPRLRALKDELNKAGL